MTDAIRQDLSPADYVILVLMMAISSLIGVFYAVRSRKSNTGTEGYLMARRTMTAIPTGISIAVSFQSTVTILGLPNDVYFYGITYICANISKIFSCVVVCYVFVPILYRMKIWSVYEYLDERFSKSIRLMNSIMSVVTNSILVGINVYGSAVTLNGVAGFNLYAGMISTGFVCVIYTALGGFRGVIWADVFQGMIMLMGMLAIFIRGCIMQGGFLKLWEIADAGSRTTINFSLDPRIRYTCWSVLIGEFITWIAILGTSQTQVQRTLSVKTQKEAKKALVLGTIGICLCGTLSVLCGLAASTIYHDCDPRLSGCVSRPDKVYPFALFNLFYGIPGLTGLFLATIFSACFSTISSCLSAIVTVIMADMVKPYTRWSDKTYIWLARGTTLLSGCLGIGLGVAASIVGDIIKMAYGCMAGFMGASLGVFLIGIWFPFANKWGALSGAMSGFVSCFVIFLGSTRLKRPQHLTGYLNFSTNSCPANCDFTMSSNTTYITLNQPSTSLNESELHGIENLFAVSIYYLTFISLVVTVFVGIIVSLLTGGMKESRNVDRRLLNPLFESKPFVWLMKRGRSHQVRSVDDNQTSDKDVDGESILRENKVLKQHEEGKL